ncbi:MAG: hypothetical protein GXO11_07620 [Epsilonproteobacteria bacterium]|nr:hypothetical protein [Campylobacterota bacterium]
MNLQKYNNKKIALFGKTRAFEKNELDSLLKQYNITLLDHYQQDVVLIVEGAIMPTPLQEKIQELYKTTDVDFIDIDIFEKELAVAIEPKKLLMSLKLSNNQERIISYLTNDYITDTLFLSLVKLYRFGNEDFFENDTNRDVTAALIRRFYKEYETNHNIQYSNVGLINTVENTTNPELLETIFSLEPTQKALYDPNHHNAKLIQILALHPQTPLQVLLHIINTKEIEYIKYIASRDQLDPTLEEKLLSMQNKTLDTLLAYMPYLSKISITTLLQRGYEDIIAQHITLDESLFETLHVNPFIALNPTLSLEMQKQLFKDKQYHLYLAKNFTCKLTKELFETNDPQIKELVLRYHNISEFSFDPSGYEFQLSHNPTTPAEILQKIYEQNNDAFNANLAKNPATPVDILYQLSFDFRYAKDVKQNPAFSQHIKTTHAIGIFE